VLFKLNDSSFKLILSYYSTSSLQHHLILSVISALYSFLHAEYHSDMISQIGHFTTSCTELGYSQKKDTHKKGGAGGIFTNISYFAFNINAAERKTRFHY